jgi:hypothetical protein
MDSEEKMLSAMFRVISWIVLAGGAENTIHQPTRNITKHHEAGVSPRLSKIETATDKHRLHRSDQSIPICVHQWQSVAGSFVKWG